MQVWLTVALILTIICLIYVTSKWLKAETKLMRFGQSTLYKKIKNSKLYKKLLAFLEKCENFFKNDTDKQQ